MSERWLYGWALGSVAFGGASLLVPLYIVQLGASTVQLGVLAATAAAIGAPGAILFGRLANRVGNRRPLVLVTLVTVAVALAVIPTLESVVAVVVANAALWLVVAAIAPVLTMVIVADAPESRWGERIGLLNKYQGYGWAGGLVLGAVWPLLGSRFVTNERVTESLFVLLAICAGMSALIGVRTLPRPKAEDHVESLQQIRRVARLLTNSNRGVKTTTFPFSPNRLYWTTRGLDLRRAVERRSPELTVYIIATILFFTGFAVFWAPLPLFLTDIGFDAEQVFGVYLASSLASAVCYGPSGRVASRYDMRLLQSTALIVRGLLFPGVALIALLSTLALEVTVALLIFTAIGITWAVIIVVGSAIITRLAPQKARSDVLGIYTASTAIAGGIGSVLGGLAATAGFPSAFGLAGGLVLLGAGLVFGVGRVTATASRATT